MTLRPIELVREDVRRVGSWVIDPPRRVVRHEDGRSVTLEPRTMQLLVALLDADGTILSRDDLIQSCWGGRIVGDDSISSVVYRLRRDLREIGADGIEIETITKVGFRLIRNGDEAAQQPGGEDREAQGPLGTGAGATAAPVVRGLRGRWWVVSSGVLLVVALAALGWWAIRPRAPAVRPLAIASVAEIGPGVGTEVPAAIGDGLRDALGDLGVPLVAGDGDLRLSTSVRRSRAGLDVTSRLDDLAAGRTLWSQSRVLAATDDRMLAAEANRVAGVLRCGLPAVDDRAASELVAMTFRVCESDDRGIALARARELSAAAPDFAPAQLLMAASAASVAAWGGPEALAARRDGTAAADRFIAMRPDMADGYVYRALLLPVGNAAARETLLRRAADRPSGYCACAVQFLGDFLAQTGRLREAVPLYQQGYDRDQVARLPLLRLILGLDWLGQNARAGALLDRFEAAHGPDPGLRYAHALYVRPRPRSLERPKSSDPALERAIATALPATASGDPVARAQAAALLRAIPVTRANEFPVAALLAELGDGAGALAIAEASRRLGNSFAAPGRYPGVTTALVWDPRFAALWRTTGFAEFLERTGYFAYWHDSQSAPDVCRANDAPSFCARLGSNRLVAAANAAHR